MHPLVDAWFNEELCEPSKQLMLVRSLFRKSTLDNPTILLILPPAARIRREIEAQSLFHDYFLLSHVVDVTDLNSKTNFETLNGSRWEVALSATEIRPERGFVANSSELVNIERAYLWSPGLSGLPYNATFFVAETDKLMINSNASKRFTWFNTARSKPILDRIGVLGLAEEPIAYTVPENDVGGNVEAAPNAVPARRLRNPASELGRTKAQRDQNMAKVDYCLACLQQDVISSTELAERFHRTVTHVRSVLIEAGGLYIEDTELLNGEHEDEDDGHAQQGIAGFAEFKSPATPPANSFTLSSVYEYAEVRLGRQLLEQLSRLLEMERKPDQPPFITLYREMKHLDITQVDIPSLDKLDTAAFERAVDEAAFILGRLNDAHNTRHMCNLFLAALKRLANPQLGTVSADTLLGLFMLTVLRTSEDTAQKLELYLHFVTHFSFQASSTMAMRASAGRISYTLMVVESVFLQLRMERNRLKKLAAANKACWAAVRADDRMEIQKIHEEFPSALCSRRNGKSVLAMAIEDQNLPLLQYLLTTFPEFNREYILKDRDLQNRSLLVLATPCEPILMHLLQFLQAAEPNKSIAEDLALVQLLNSKDQLGRNLAFYLHAPSQFGDAVGPYLNWTFRDCDLNTPLLHHFKVFVREETERAAEVNELEKDSDADRAAESSAESSAESRAESMPFTKFCSNFFHHLDSNGNSLLHFAVRADSLPVVNQCLGIPSTDVDWMNKFSETPLMVAKFEPVIMALLAAGADPWLGTLDALHSPAIRQARLGRNAQHAYIASTPGSDHQHLQIFKPAFSERALLKSVADFAGLSSQLQAASPNSWLPPLKYTYASEKLKLNSFAQRFSTEFNELEMQRLDLWLRQIGEHATFAKLAETAAFYNETETETEAETETGTNTETEKGSSTGPSTETSLFGREDENSMQAFLRLGSERLSEVQAGLEELVRYLARVDTLQIKDTRLRFSLNDKLRSFSRTCSSRFDSVDSELWTRLLSTSTSLSTRVTTEILDQLAQYTNHLNRKIQHTLYLFTEVEANRQLLQSFRERLKQLAEGSMKVAWLGNVEEKRVAEIKQAETATANCRKTVKMLDVEIRASFYFLASELSSFNQAQEKEILNQVEAYSREQLNRAKLALKRLEFGTRITK